MWDLDATDTAVLSLSSNNTMVAGFISFPLFNGRKWRCISVLFYVKGKQCFEASLRFTESKTDLILIHVSVWVSVSRSLDEPGGNPTPQWEAARG